MNREVRSANVRLIALVLDELLRSHLHTASHHTNRHKAEAAPW